MLPGQGAAADSLRAVLDSVFSGRAYRWVDRPHPLAFLLRWWDAIQRWLGGLQEREPGLYWVIFAGLVAVLVAILAHAIYVMTQTLRAARAPAAGPAAGIRPEVRGARWYRREAERLAAAGRFPEAMQADFLALVLELDQRRVLTFHPSKTPAEYGRDPGLAEPGRSAFRDLVAMLYGYAFARLPCGPEEFAAWQARAVPEAYAPAH